MTSASGHRASAETAAALPWSEENHASLAFPDFDSANRLVNGLEPDLWGLNPRRGRDWGMEFQYRF